jgi:hypothetical protein
MSVTALNPIHVTSEPTVTVETITPAIAEEWLKRNTHNRNIRQRHVETLAHAMTEGQWMLNGQSVTFDPNGVLVDGQHRLKAVVVSGVTIDSVVVRGVDMSAQITVDVGPGRSFGDVLHWRGETSTNVLAAGVRALHRFKYGDAYASQSTSLRVTFADLLAVLDAHPGIRQSCKKAEALRKAVKVPAGPMAGLHYVLWELSPLDADTFYERIADGIELTSTNPIYLLRRAFITDTNSAKKLSVRHRLALTIKAWNFWLAGTDMKLLVWRSGGATREDFPTPDAPA